MKEPRPARGLLILVPLAVIWLGAWALEEGVGFTPAYGQAGTTTRTIHNVPQSSVPNPTSSIQNPDNPTTTKLQPTTTTRPMPATTRVPRGTFPDPTNAVGTTPPVSPGPAQGANWVCAPNAGAPGTHCWDP